MSRFIFFAIPALLLALLALSFAPFDAGAAKSPTFEKVDSSLLKGLPKSGDYALGKKGAPVQLVEYASLSCPHCAHFHRDVFPALKPYIDDGKLLYIFRNFPLNEPALKGALLTECVGGDGGADRFYTFVKVLFDAQGKWAFDQNYLAALETFARVGGVPKEKFDACVNDASHELELLKAKQEAAKELKVDRTPYIFINGKRFDDDLTAEKVTAYIDAQLGK